MQSKRFVKNFISLVILQGANYILPLITFPYLVSVLEVEKYGTLAYSLAFAQYFVMISAYGFNLYAPREIALHRENQKIINEIFSSVFIIKFGLTIVGGIVYFLLVFMIPKMYEFKYVFLAMYGVVIGQSLLPVWFFQGIEKMTNITVINIISRSIYAISIFLFIRQSSDLIKIPIFNSIGYIVGGTIGLYISFTKFNVKLIWPKYNVLKLHFKQSSQFFLSRISVSLYTFSNTFVLGTFGTMEMAGIYAIAEKLYNALQGIYHPLVNALYPFITVEKNVKIFKQIFFVASIINLIGLFGIFIFSENAFRILFQDFNYESIMVFKILLFACIIIVPSILIGYPFLAAFGFPRYANFSVVVPSLIHLLLLLTLVIFNRVDAVLVAIFVVLTEFIVLIIRLYGSFKYKLW